MRQESWVKCYAKYYGDAIKAADHDALSLSRFPLLPHWHSLLLPLGVAALLQEHPVHWWQVSGISVVQLTHAHDTHSKSIESREEGNGRAGAEPESASSVAWKSATATAAAAALTLSATVNLLLTCAKPFVYFCLAADTKKITKRAAKIKGRAPKMLQVQNSVKTAEPSMHRMLLSASHALYPGCSLPSYVTVLA